MVKNGGGRYLELNKELKELKLKFKKEQDSKERLLMFYRINEVEYQIKKIDKSIPRSTKGGGNYKPSYSFKNIFKELRSKFIK